MEKELRELIKRVIKEELGELVVEQMQIHFKQLHSQNDTILKGQDGIVEQLREDRRDINKNTEDIARIAKQGSVIIDNQNHQEDRVADAVEEAVSKIPAKVERSVGKLFDNRPLLKRLVDKFRHEGKS